MHLKTKTDNPVSKGRKGEESIETNLLIFSNNPKYEGSYT